MAIAATVIHISLIVIRFNTPMKTAIKDPILAIVKVLGLFSFISPSLPVIDFSFFSC